MPRSTAKPSAMRPEAPLRIAFITEAGSSFNNALGAAVAAHADPAVVCSFHAVSASDVKPIGFGQTIERFAQSSQGPVVVARENLTINRAIRSAVARGVPVVCLTTDLPNSNRTCYVGSDQITAGAQAALLMGRMLRGQAGEIVLVISSRYRSQEERERGFRRVLRSDFPGLRVVERVNSNDELEFLTAASRNMLRSGGHPSASTTCQAAMRGLPEPCERHACATASCSSAMSSITRRGRFSKTTICISPSTTISVARSP